MDTTTSNTYLPDEIREVAEGLRSGIEDPLSFPPEFVTEHAKLKLIWLLAEAIVSEENTIYDEDLSTNSLASEYAWSVCEHDGYATYLYDLAMLTMDNFMFAAVVKDDNEEAIIELCDKKKPSKLKKDIKKLTPMERLELIHDYKVFLDEHQVYELGYFY